MTEDDLLILMVQAEDRHPHAVGAVLRLPGEPPALHLGDRKLRLADVRPYLNSLLRDWYIARNPYREEYSVAEAGRKHYQALTCG